MLGTVMPTVQRLIVQQSPKVLSELETTTPERCVALHGCIAPPTSGTRPPLTQQITIHNTTASSMKSSSMQRLKLCCVLALVVHGFNIPKQIFSSKTGKKKSPMKTFN
jgi:hypothetical protein